MSNPQFTPGPWHLESNQFLIRDDKHAVASAYNTNAPEPMAGIARASARLIASAPELYQALKACSASLLCATKHIPCEDLSTACDCHACEAFSQASAALAKAVGETH